MGDFDLDLDFFGDFDLISSNLAPFLIGNLLLVITKPFPLLGDLFLELSKEFLFFVVFFIGGYVF